MAAFSDGNRDYRGEDSNGVAFLLACSELLVTASMCWYLSRRRLLPLVSLHPGNAGV
jgi:hypothetical protein